MEAELEVRSSVTFGLGIALKLGFDDGGYIDSCFKFGIKLNSMLTLRVRSRRMVTQDLYQEIICAETALNE